MMLYIIDTKTTPPVVVLQVRGDTPSAENIATAQRYADQTSHVLVAATGPDAVMEPANVNVIHPTAHAPSRQEELPVAGVNLAPEHHGAIAGDLSAVWNLLKSLEPVALDTLLKLLGALVSPKK